MLYLPAQLMSKKEIRLPAYADDLVSMCALLPEQEQFDLSLVRLLRRSPGLLIYVANHYKHHHSRPLADFNQVIDWVKFRLFDSAIESDAFAQAELSNQHLKKLLSWQEQPTVKRLTKYLTSVTGFDSSICKELLSQMFSNQFDFDELASIESDAGFVNPSKSTLPVRSMWLMCAKIQRLKSDFETELRTQKLAAMKQLAYGASHEINNPLANIATRAQTLLADEDLPSKRQKLSVIYAQAMRAHEMISDMMLFANPPELTIESTDMLDLIEKIGVELRPVLRQKKIKFVIRKYPGVENCDFDQTQIAVALKAILENSIAAIGVDGEIRIQVWGEDGQLGIGIVDDGPGIDPELGDKLFDPFFSGREAGRGLGFGLSKAWRIAELHGGKLIIDTEYCDGARVVMRLPLKQEFGQKKDSRIDNVRAA